MSEAWLIRKTDDYDRFKYSVGGCPSCTVPLVNCPECGDIRSTWGLLYPSIDIGALGNETLDLLDCEGGRRRREPLTLEQYRALEERLAPILGPGRPLAPSAGLGPSTGGAAGAFPDFAWGSGPPRDLYMRRSVFEAFRDAGFDLTGVEPNLEYRRERKDPLIELEILPGLHIHKSQRPEPCPTCGFAGKRPEGIRIDPNDYDDSIPLQRIHERAEFIVANAAFVALIREQGMTDVRLSPMIFE
jgi:hypothetical protein